MSCMGKDSKDCNLKDDQVDVDHVVFDQLHLHTDSPLQVPTVHNQLNTTTANLEEVERLIQQHQQQPPTAALASTSTNAPTTPTTTTPTDRSTTSSTAADGISSNDPEVIGPSNRSRFRAMFNALIEEPPTSVTAAERGSRGAMAYLMVGAGAMCWSTCNYVYVVLYQCCSTCRYVYLDIQQLCLTLQ